MGRVILSAAAVCKAAWSVPLHWPGSIPLKSPPLLGVLTAGIGLAGAAFAAGLGYLAWSRWPVPAFNGPVWLPPLMRFGMRTGGS